MKTLLQFAAVLALVVFSAGAAVVTLDAHKLLADSDAMVLHADAVTQELADNLPGYAVELHSILESATKTADSAEAAAAEQRAYWQKTSTDSDKTVKALRLVVDRAGLLLKHTDEQLNSSLLPDVDREVVRTSEAAQMSISSLGQAGDALTFQLNDLHVAEISTHLDEATLRINATALALQHTAESGEHVAKFYEDKLTKPASLAKTVFNGAMDLGSKFGSMFAGFAK